MYADIRDGSQANDVYLGRALLFQKLPQTIAGNLGMRWNRDYERRLASKSRIW
jgi:hypothetical protein